MHELMELKEMLCEELEKYGNEELTAGSLEVVDKLSHAIKNIGKIIEMYEDEDYSNEYRGDSYRQGSYRGESYRRGNSRGSSRRGGSYAQRRDSRGRYSRDSSMVEELRDLMEDAPNEKTRKEFEKFISKIEMM